MSAVLDPVAVTSLPDASLGVFGPNREQPFHRWVHLTEGYSAQLVARELQAASRDALVYDPFGGTGTTPLVAAELGLRAVWAEVNPYLRAAATTKVMAATATLGERARAARELSALLASTPVRTGGEHPLIRVNEGRGFFAPHVATDLVDWARHLGSAGGLAGRVGELAVASCAISVSNMTRAVDLRRRTAAELSRLAADVGVAVRRRVALMCEDLSEAPVAHGDARCVSADARTKPVASAEIGLVVTSPPYLNGTNYCRNTKLELLLLGLIDTEDGLGPIRSASVTAGINNVSKRTRSPTLIPEVEATATALDERSYDVRIPKMVRAYFSDMLAVFLATRQSVEPGARFVLDIGDSRFAGVHIDTPGLLTSVAASAGWCLHADEVIRARVSKDGTPLCQKLLRFTAA